MVIGNHDKSRSSTVPGGNDESPQVSQGTQPPYGMVARWGPRLPLEKTMFGCRTHENQMKYA